MKKRSPAARRDERLFTGGLQRSYRTLDGVLKLLLTIGRIYAVIKMPDQNK